MSVIPLFKTCLEPSNIIQAVFSSPLKKSPTTPSKISIRPIILHDQLHYQISSYIAQKVLHQNVAPTELLQLIESQFLTSFKQGTLFTPQHDYHLLADKTGQWRVLTKPATLKQHPLSLAHNRVKNYMIPENVPLDFLIELGVMNPQGRILSAKRDKFIQINRFLEMVSDTLSHLDKSKTVRIVDFGCGKAYLTFALHHLLTQIQGLKVDLIGLDLKQDVIAFCSSLAKKLNLNGLSFALGDVHRYSTTEKVDMVVALHACDTATDAALKKAVQWNAEVILAAPCCQQELYKQLTQLPLEGILKYGILKERFAALLTDAIRANALEAAGYSTQVLEFIDSEHTPKNLLIRAVKGISKEKQHLASLQLSELMGTFQINPSIIHH